MEAVLAGGVAPDRIVVDPGLGFSKDAEHDLVLLAHLDRLLALGHPLLVAASRKRFLGRVLAGPEGAPPPARERDAATAAVSALAAHAGAWAVRVHEVRATADAVRVARAVEGRARPAPARPRTPTPRPPGDRPHTDVEQVELANTAFYETLERGDFDELSSLWLTPADLGVDEEYHDPADSGVISCVHPGWPVLTGRGEVLRSYALIMANTELHPVLPDRRACLGDRRHRAGDLHGEHPQRRPVPDDSDELGPLVGQLVVATNVFRRTPDGWKLWSHHASPVMAENDEDEGEDTPT